MKKILILLAVMLGVTAAQAQITGGPIVPLSDCEATNVSGIGLTNSFLVAPANAYVIQRTIVNTNTASDLLYGPILILTNQLTKTFTNQQFNTSIIYTTTPPNAVVISLASALPFYPWVVKAGTSTNIGVGCLLYGVFTNAAGSALGTSTVYSADIVVAK